MEICPMCGKEKENLVKLKVPVFIKAQFETEDSVIYDKERKDYKKVCSECKEHINDSVSKFYEVFVGPKAVFKMPYRRKEVSKEEVI